MSSIVSALGSDIGLYYHERLIKALISRDSELAKQTMAEHIDRTIDALRAEPR